MESRASTTDADLGTLPRNRNYPYLNLWGLRGCGHYGLTKFLRAPNFPRMVEFPEYNVSEGQSRMEGATADENLTYYEVIN